MGSLIRIILTITLIIAVNLSLWGQQDNIINTDSSKNLEGVQIVTVNKGDRALNAVLFSPNANGLYDVELNGTDKKIEFLSGFAELNEEIDLKGKLMFLKFNTAAGKTQKLYHVAKQKDGGFRVVKIPLWLSVIPPLLAIILALVFKEVIISLFIGIWSGAFIAGGLRFSSFYYWMQSFFDTVRKYVIDALNDSGHISVIVFSLLIGGMVAIISKNGGMAGVVKSLSKYARSARSTQFITWLLGVAIFFDDYANTLIVGNTMRSVTDRFNISREKLAYIVDSTAAPVSAIAFITTWIGAELGYIDDGLAQLSLDGNLSAYGVFISSLKYSFYPVLTLIFLLILIYSKKDYGTMYAAELRARTTGQVSPAKTNNDDEPDMEDLSPVKGVKIKWYNAFIPVATVILMTIFGLVETGMQGLYGELIEIRPGLNQTYSGIWNNLDLLGYKGMFTKLGALVGSSDSYVALIWASLSGVAMAIVLTLSQRIMSLFDTMHWMSTGFKTMLPALIILTLAWSLALATDELHTADYISSSLENSIHPYMLPIIVFVLAALIAFSTGSSWSTMAILYPIVIPTTYAVCQANGFEPNLTLEILYNVIATVLAASVLGDHCSPISDTTILSSLAADCNHIDHVKTQMPYALTVGAVSLVCVGLSTVLGGGWLISFVMLLLGVAALYFTVRYFGKEIPPDANV